MNIDYDKLYPPNCAVDNNRPVSRVILESRDVREFLKALNDTDVCWGSGAKPFAGKIFNELSWHSWFLIVFYNESRGRRMYYEGRNSNDPGFCRDVLYLEDIVLSFSAEDLCPMDLTQVFQLE